MRKLRKKSKALKIAQVRTSVCSPLVKNFFQNKKKDFKILEDITISHLLPICYFDLPRMSRKLYFFLSPCVRLNTNLRFLNCCSSHPQHFFYCFILWSQKKIKMLPENEKSEKIKFE